MTKVMNAFSLQGMTYFVYILASQRNGTLYVGVTNNLARRIHEHREKSSKGLHLNTR
jgi:predicted GIY-YIG superfamily endonuclease